MPLYVVGSLTERIPDSGKQSIAQAITKVHCKTTGAPPGFVHVFFFDQTSQRATFEKLSGNHVASASYQIFGSIRSGRTDELKNTLVMGMRLAVAGILDAKFDDVLMATRDVDAKWVMEGGDLLPEPGEEAAWLEKHAS